MLASGIIPSLNIEGDIAHLEPRLDTLSNRSTNRVPWAKSPTVVYGQCRSGFDRAPNNYCPTPQEQILREFMSET